MLDVEAKGGGDITKSHQQCWSRRFVVAGMVLRTREVDD
jgi:hypothetical protein